MTKNIENMDENQLTPSNETVKVPDAGTLNMEQPKAAPIQPSQPASEEAPVRTVPTYTPSSVAAATVKPTAPQATEVPAAPQPVATPAVSQPAVIPAAPKPMVEPPAPQPAENPATHATSVTEPLKAPVAAVSAPKPAAVQPTQPTQPVQPTTPITENNEPMPWNTARVIQVPSTTTPMPPAQQAPYPKQTAPMPPAYTEPSGYQPPMAATVQPHPEYRYGGGAYSEPVAPTPVVAPPKAKKEPKYATMGQMIGAVACAALLAGGACFMIGQNTAGSSSGTPSSSPTVSTITGSDDAENSTLAHDVAAKAVPSVVSIYTYQVVNNYYNDPFSWYFGGQGGQDGGYGYGGQQQGGQEELSGMGSGVIISTDGYIMTNYHVVEDSSSIKVGIDNKEYDAEVVGGDPTSDVAVVKIKAEDGETFPAIELADSSAVQIGDWVMAIGSPYGYTETVTTGIISATGRSTAIQSTTGTSIYANMIQTDAAINTGNSGGALVDRQGRLIGMNTMISSSSGASAGIGFAIPSNYAMNIAKQIMDGNKDIQHAQIGVTLEKPAEGTVGAVVESITKDSAADKAGLKAGDIITKLDDEEITTSSDLIYAVKSHLVGDKVTLEFTRDGKPQSCEITLGSDK